MSAFAGLRGSGDWGTDERPKNFRELILWANPNGSAPLTALMAKMAKESVDDPEFSWWQEKLLPTRLSINDSTGYTTTNTTLTILADGLKLVPGDLLMLEKTEVAVLDNEIVQVSAVTSDTVIVVKRGRANTTPTAIADGAYFTKIGSAFEEGSLSPDISQRNPTKSTNYCQIFKTTVGITGTAEKIKIRTGDGWKQDKKRKSFDHSVDMEMAFLYGVPYEDTSGTKPKRFTGGLRSFITTNVTLFATTPTEDTILAALYPVFDYSKDSSAGDQRVVFAGNGALNTLNKLARGSGTSQLRVLNETVKIYGMNLQRWVMPQGELAIKTHPLMNLHGRFTNCMFVIDPTNIKYRPLRDTSFKDNTQANDSDSRQGYWLTEAGIEVQHEYTMAYLANITYP